jgi:hypothetical protein
VVLDKTWPRSRFYGVERGFFVVPPQTGYLQNAP